jgi:hypothetical protein
MNANDIKQDVDWGSMENTAMVHKTVAAFRMCDRLSEHYKRLIEQGFPLHERLKRFLQPPPTVAATNPPEPACAATHHDTLTDVRRKIASGETIHVDPKISKVVDFETNKAAECVAHALIQYMGQPAALKHYALTSSADMAAKATSIKNLLEAVVALASSEGVVVSVENLVPAAKPAMGKHYTRIDSRLKRPIYQHFEKSKDSMYVRKSTDELNRELGALARRLNGLEADLNGTYVDIGWVINGVALKTQAQLDEKIVRVALDNGVDLFKENPILAAAPVVEHIGTRDSSGCDDCLTLTKGQAQDEVDCAHLNQLEPADPTRFPPQLDDPATFQMRVMQWIAETFTPMEMDIFDVLERALRFQEESMELAQTFGVPYELALKNLNSVYGKEPGERNQEVGGAMTTLAALCEAVGINMLFEGEKELARVWTKIPQIREKNLSKVRSIGKMSPSGVTPEELAQSPAVVLSVIQNLSERGTKIAHQLAQKGMEAIERKALAPTVVPLAGDFGAYDHPYLADTPLDTPLTMDGHHPNQPYPAHVYETAASYIRSYLAEEDSRVATPQAASENTEVSTKPARIEFPEDRLTNIRAPYR